VPGPVSIAQQAAHCRSLMRHLGIERAHVIGYSSSANMALHLALDAPDPLNARRIEDYHAQGKLTNEEAKAFNSEVANKLYTFLEYMFNQPPQDQQSSLGAWMDSRRSHRDLLRHSLCIRKRSGVRSFRQWIPRSQCGPSPAPGSHARSRNAGNLGNGASLWGDGIAVLHEGAVGARRIGTAGLVTAHAEVRSIVYRNREQIAALPAASR
jgi:pimeloyl-ACP methyl ester carboxylesterase